LSKTLEKLPTHDVTHKNNLIMIHKKLLLVLHDFVQYCKCLVQELHVLQKNRLRTPVVIRVAAAARVSTLNAANNKEDCSWFLDGMINGCTSV
jgi:hypothetical protein